MTRIDPKQLQRLEQAKKKVTSLVSKGVQMNWSKASDTALEARYRRQRDQLSKPYRER